MAFAIVCRNIPSAEALPPHINIARVNTRALARTHSVQFTHAFACRTINIRAPSRTRPRAISRLCLWQLSRTAKRYFHSSLCGAHIPTNVGFHPLAVRADFTRALARISPDAVPRLSLSLALAFAPSAINKHKLRLTFIKKSLKITLLFKKGIDIVLCIKYTAIVKSR